MSDAEPALETVVVRGLQTAISQYRSGADGASRLVPVLHTGLSRLLAEHGVLELRCAGQFIHLVGQRLPRGDDDRVYTRRLLRQLRHCGISGLRIQPGLGVGELQKVLEVLGRASLPGELLCEVPGRLRRAQVVHVQVIEQQHERTLRFPGGLGFSVHRTAAQRLYLEGLELYGRVTSAVRTRETLPWLSMRRWVQRLADLMEEDESPILGLTQIKSIDEYELTHAVNVTVLSVALARAGGLSNRDVDDVGMAAFVHDVGQCEVPDEVLTRQGALSDEDWSKMRQHTLHGAARLLDSGPPELAAPAALAALEHHMGISGEGYPKVPEGTRTSTAARIIHITDTYDALTSRRVYRLHPVRPDQALMLLLERSEAVFDASWVQCFVRLLGLYPPGTTVKLDTDEVGVVVRANRNARMLHRPQVCVMLNSTGEPTERDTVVDLTERGDAPDAYVRSVRTTLDPEPFEIAPASLFMGND
jgi:HD-GYP domain-containing protein (c-di-GMP phosphodiesterase class II)